MLWGSETYEDENFEKKTKQLSAADVYVLKIFVANYDWCVVIFCKSFLHIVSDWGKKFGAHSEG